MTKALPGLLAICTFLMPASAWAGDIGWFGGFDLSGGAAFGSSSTTDGGAPFAGGGIVSNVKFGPTAGVGGHVGYRFDPHLSGYVSYQYVRGNVGWDAAFPNYGVASSFAGSAISNILMGNLAYEMPLSSTATARASAGAGLAFNSLAGIVETDAQSGLFVSDVTDHTRISPSAGVGAGIRQKFGKSAALGLDASVSYTGSFETGDTRSGNLGITDITPYRIDNVWRTDLDATLQVAF